MDDPSVLNRNDRDKPVVVGCAARKNLAVYFILEDDDATILAAMDNKLVAGVKLDRLAVSGQLVIKLALPWIFTGQPGKW